MSLLLMIAFSLRDSAEEKKGPIEIELHPDSPPLQF